MSGQEIDDEDNPEWTAEDFARARPMREVNPELHAAIMVNQAAAEVTLRLEPKVTDFFQSRGPDWRDRMGAALERAAGVGRSVNFPVLGGPTT